MNCVHCMGKNQSSIERMLIRAQTEQRISKTTCARSSRAGGAGAPGERGLCAAGLDSLRARVLEAPRAMRKVG